jgi:hypothetical protein
MMSEDERKSTEDPAFATDSPRLSPSAKAGADRPAAPELQANEWDHWKSVRDVG